MGAIDRRQLFAAAGVIAVSGPLAGGDVSGYVRDELASMDAALARLLAEHETAPPAKHLAEVQTLRTRAASLGRSGGPGAARIISRTTGIEAQSAGWTRSPQEAWRSALVARDLAVHEGDRPAAALATGLLSVLRRYQGHPQAVPLAEQARKMAPASHPVQLVLMTTHARALAEGAADEVDHDALDRLLDEALDRADRLPTAQRASRPGLTFDQASPEEITYAASIAWLRAGSPKRAGEHVTAAQTVMDTKGLTNFASMLRVERAIHVMRGGACTCGAAQDTYPVHLRWCKTRPDVEQSCALVDETLTRQGTVHSELVTTRLVEWTRLAWPMAGNAGVHQTIGRVADWRAAQMRAARGTSL